MCTHKEAHKLINIVLVGFYDLHHSLLIYRFAGFDIRVQVEKFIFVSSFILCVAF